MVQCKNVHPVQQCRDVKFVNLPRMKLGSTPVAVRTRCHLRPAPKVPLLSVPSVAGRHEGRGIGLAGSLDTSIELDTSGRDDDTTRGDQFVCSFRVSVTMAFVTGDVELLREVPWNFLDEGKEPRWSGCANDPRRGLKGFDDVTILAVMSQLEVELRFGERNIHVVDMRLEERSVLEPPLNGTVHYG